MIQNKMRIPILAVWMFLSFLLSGINLYSQSKTLSLSEAIEKTLNNNYGILISEITIEQAATSNTSGNAGGLPTIGFDASSQNSYRFSDDNTTWLNNLSADLGFSWKIFDGFKVRATKEKLQFLEELSSGQSAVVIENSIQNLIDNYYYILLIQENMKVLEKLKQLSKDRYNYEQARFELGGSVSVNVLLAKNLWLDDQASYLQQEIAIKDAMRTLNFIMAEKDNPYWTLTEEFKFEEKEFIVSNMIDRMLAHNQVLKNQYINQSLKEQDRKIKESDLLPDLYLSGGISNNYSRSKTSGSDASSSNTFYPYGNLSLSYDIFTGGVRNTAIKVAELNEKIEQVQADEMIHNLSNSVLGIYDNYLLKKELLLIAEENLEVAEMNLSISEEKFKNGSITSFEYRDIQLIFLNAAQNRLSAIYDLIDIETELTRLTGGFISPE